MRVVVQLTEAVATVSKLMEGEATIISSTAVSLTGTTWYHMSMTISGGITHKTVSGQLLLTGSCSKVNEKVGCIGNFLLTSYIWLQSLTSNSIFYDAPTL